MSNINKKERDNRTRICCAVMETVRKTIKVEEESEACLFLSYSGFYLQIAFSHIHPLIIIHLARQLDWEISEDIMERINALNSKSVFGAHFLSDESDCYLHRSTYWLDTEISGTRFIEILDRCVLEADAGYSQLFTN